MVTQTMERRLTQRGRERRTQLMQFAAKRFAENGYHPTSVAEIVDELGVGKGVFYWYFESKEELFIEILRDAQLALRRRQQQAIGTEPDPVLRIVKGLYATMHFLAENRHLFNLFQFAVTEKTFSPVMRQGAEVGAADTMRHVSEGMRQGRFVDGDPWMITHAIIGVTNELARRGLHMGSSQPDEVARAAVEFCLHGMVGSTNIEPTEVNRIPVRVSSPQSGEAFRSGWSIPTGG